MLAKLNPPSPGISASQCVTKIRLTWLLRHGEKRLVGHGSRLRSLEAIKKNGPLQKFMDKVGQASSRNSVPCHYFLTANFLSSNRNRVAMSR